MVRALLVRGLLVGLLAGALAFAFALVFGEPQVEAAIAFEQLQAAKAGDPGEAELVSRGVQRTIGLLTGTVAIGVALGGLFALAYAYGYGRISITGPRPTAAVLALEELAVPRFGQYGVGPGAQRILPAPAA